MCSCVCVCVGVGVRVCFCLCPPTPMENIDFGSNELTHSHTHTTEHHVFLQTILAFCAQIKIPPLIAMAFHSHCAMQYMSTKFKSEYLYCENFH